MFVLLLMCKEVGTPKFTQGPAHLKQISTRAPPTDAIYALQMFVDNDPHHNILNLFI